MSRVKVTGPDHSPVELTEQKQISEIECLVKMRVVYEKEIEMLKAKLKQDVGSEKVIEFEKKVSMGKANRADMQKESKELQKKIKEKEKELSKASSSKEKGTPQIEETKMLKLLNKEAEKKEELSQKLKQENDVILAKEVKIKEFDQKIGEIEIEIAELKKLAAAAIGADIGKIQQEKPGEDTKKELAEYLKRLQVELNEEVRKNEREVCHEREKMQALHDTYKDIVHVLFGKVLTWLEK